MKKHWKFIDSQWPEMKPSKYHRTDKKDICDMKHIKEVVVNRLGIIPVFFFLIVLYPFKHHPGPYRNVEKGLLILYHLLKFRIVTWELLYPKVVSMIFIRVFMVVKITPITN